MRRFGRDGKQPWSFGKLNVLSCSLCKKAAACGMPSLADEPGYNRIAGALYLIQRPSRRTPAWPPYP